MSSMAPEPFVFDPANQAFLNGQSTRLRPPNTDPGMKLLMLVLALALLMSAMTAREWYTMAQIAFYGTAAQAVVTDSRIESAPSESGTSTDFRIFYRYSVKDRVYTSNQTVNELLFNQVGLSCGTPIDILYSRMSPEISNIAGYPSGSDLFRNLFLLGFTVLLNMGAYAAVSGKIQTARQDRRLAREGQFIQGQVVTCKVEPSDAGSFMTLQYAFQSPQGTPITGEETREDSRDELPAPGTPVTVIFADDQCYRAL